MDEIKLLEKVNNALPNSLHRMRVVELYDSFKICGPHGNHVAMAFEVLGPNLLTLIKKYNHKGIPSRVVKKITKQVLMGLEYLHDGCGIIHTDLKPENILIEIDVEERMKELGVVRIILGKEEYMTPQKIQKESTQIESASKFDVETIIPLTANQKKKLKQKAKKLAMKVAAGQASLENSDVEMVKLEVNISKETISSDSEQDKNTLDTMAVSTEEQDSRPSSPLKYRAELPPTPPSKNHKNGDARLIEDTGSIGNSSAEMNDIEETEEMIEYERILSI
jgi:serine/threonine-protein kinase SRPK3